MIQKYEKHVDNIFLGKGPVTCELSCKGPIFTLEIRNPKHILSQ